jgi:hypothetical protein
VDLLCGTKSQEHGNQWSLKLPPSLPILFEEAMNKGLWWIAEIPLIGLEFSKL